MEEWRPVVGVEGYEVSNLGRVRSLDREIECPHWDKYAKRFVMTRRRLRGRLLRPGPQAPCGHLSVCLGRGNSRLVHVLVLEAFVGPKPEGHEGAHWDDEPENNRLENLRWATRGDNLRDAVRNGRKAAGESHPLAKLTTEAVREIRLAPRRYGVVAAFARRFGVSESTIRQARDGRAWRHVCPR